MFWAAHRVGGTGTDDLACHQPVEEHADGGQLLLCRGFGIGLLELLDIRGDPLPSYGKDEVHSCWAHV
jgi:hypothetical protein